jgi:hypothetical protein
MDPAHLHAPVHYLLGQALLRAGRQEEGKPGDSTTPGECRGGGGPAAGAATFEKSKFTQARVPFKLRQPDQEGVRVRFVDATNEAFAGNAEKFSGPIALINANQKGAINLFVLESGASFRGPSK